jgi:hypothetical protein
MQNSSSRGRRARLRAAAVGLAAATGLGGAPVLAATTGGAEHFSGTDSYSYSDCGFPVDVDVTFSGSEVLRTTKGGEAFLSRGTLTYREVHTNTLTGKSFVVRGHSTTKELRATQVEGTIYRFDAVEAGQPFVIEDADGNVVLRDRGAIRYAALFDTLGDGQPGAVFLGDVNEPIVRGPHPGFGEDFDFCAIASELTAA